MANEQNRSIIAKMLKSYPELLTIKETMKILRCGEKSLRKMLTDGQISYIMIAQRYLIVKEYLIDYIAEHGCFPKDGDDDA